VRCNWFHRPETLQGWLARITGPTPTPMFRAGVRAMPPLDRTGLRPAQFDAITKLEQSLAHDRAHRAAKAKIMGPEWDRTVRHLSARPGTGRHASCPLTCTTAPHVITRHCPACPGSDS